MLGVEMLNSNEHETDLGRTRNRSLQVPGQIPEEDKEAKESDTKKLDEEC